MKHLTCYDHIGTAYQVFSHERKQVEESRVYDVFGNLINKSGSSTGNIGFQSKFYDTESGLNYFYHRYYYPNIGRFINEDPIGLISELNLYKFVKNNPIQLKDPFGHHILEEYEEVVRQYRIQIEKLRILLREHRRDLIEESRYCPTWGECYSNCIKAALFSGINTYSLFAIQVNFDIFKSLTKVGKIVLKKISIAWSFGEAIASLGISAYCAIHCLFNKRAY